MEFGHDLFIYHIYELVPNFRSCKSTLRCAILTKTYRIRRLDVDQGGSDMRPTLNIVMFMQYELRLDSTVETSDPPSHKQYNRSRFALEEFNMYTLSS